MSLESSSNSLKDDVLVEEDPQKWMKRAVQRLVRFCCQTTMHGMQFLVSENNPDPLRRLIWFTVVFAAWGAAFVLLQQAVLDWYNAVTQTSIQIPPNAFSLVTFPSLTVCSFNEIRRSITETVRDKDDSLWTNLLLHSYCGHERNYLSDSQIDRLLKNVLLLDKVVGQGLVYQKLKSQEPLTATSDHLLSNLSREEIELAKASPKAKAGWFFKTFAHKEPGETSILTATYQFQQKDGQMFTQFMPFFGTDSGRCVLIKPQLTFHKDLDHLPFDTMLRESLVHVTPGIVMGKKYGVQLVMDAEVFDYGYNPVGIQGFQLAIHHHRDKPIMRIHSVNISPGHVTDVVVKPLLTTTTKEARFRFAPNDRGCYFDEEFEFKSLSRREYRYSLTNCYFAAVVDQIILQCRCVPYFLPDMLGTEFEDLNGTKMLLETPCYGHGLSCMQGHMRHIGNYTSAYDRKNVHKQCLPQCNEQSYDISAHSVALPALDTFRNRTDLLCPLVSKLLNRTCKSSRKAGLNETYPLMCELLEMYSAGKLTIPACDNVQRNSPKAAFCKRDDLLRRRLPLRNTRNFLLKSERPEEEEHLLRLLYQYASENVAVSHVYFRSPFILKLERDQKIPTIWFVANLGGIIGLACGMSLVTWVEMFATLCETFYYWLRQMHRDYNHEAVEEQKQKDPDEYKKRLANSLNNL